MGCCNNPFPPHLEVGVNPPAYPGPPMGNCSPRPPMPPVPPVTPACKLPCDQTVFRRVLIPATMGDHTTLTPESLEYRNVVLEYEADSYVYIYSSDGVATLISNGTGTNFNDLTNRPMYNGQAMTGLTNIPEVPTSISDLSDAARITCIESTNQALKQSYNVMNTAIVNLTQTVDTQGDTLIELQNNIDTLDCKKQDVLVSGQNIRTINGLSLLGEGNVEITFESAGVQPLLVSGENIKKVGGADILGAGNIDFKQINGEDIVGTGNIEFPTAKLYDETGANTDGALTQKFTSEEFADVRNTLNTNSSNITGLQKDVLDLQTSSSAISGTEIQTDTKLGTDLSSTVTLIKTTGPINGTKTDTEIPLPVVSATQSGVMNPEMYAQIQDNSNKIQVILGNSTVVPTLPADPTDEQITAAYKEATGQTEVPNGAKIIGSEGKTYIYNAATQKWETYSEGGGAIEVKPFTNEEAGTIIGNDVDGGVVSDGGKGLVKGWDKHTADIANNAAAIETANTNITNLTNQVNTLETTVNQSGTDLTELEAKVTTNTTNIAANTALIGDVDALLKRLDTGTGVQYGRPNQSYYCKC